MSPELIAAIKERIELGHSKEAIRAELHDAGYDDQMVEAAYAEAHPSARLSHIPVPRPSASDLETVNTGGNRAVLPSAVTLFKDGWTFMMSRLDLLFLLAIPFAVTAILAFVLNTSPLPSQSLTVALPGLVSLVALVGYLYIWTALLYTVVQSQEQVISWGKAFAWARSNLSGLIWVNLLASLVVLGGFILFIIPGIIISLYVYFVQYVYAKEGVRGIEALLRSRDLVQGNWWALLSRLFVLGLIFFVIFIVLGSLAGSVASISGEEPVAMVILGVVFQFLGAGTSLIALHAGMSLHHALGNARPASAGSTLTGRGKYTTLAWLGLAFPILMIFLTIPLVALIDVDVREKELETVEQQEMSNVESSTEAKKRAWELRTSGEPESLTPLE